MFTGCSRNGSLTNIIRTRKSIVIQHTAYIPRSGTKDRSLLNIRQKLILHFGALRNSQMRSALDSFLVSNDWFGCGFGGDITFLMMTGWRFFMCNSNARGRMNSLWQCRQWYPSKQRWHRDTPSPLNHWLFVYSSPDLCWRHWPHLRSMERFNSHLRQVSTKKGANRNFAVLRDSNFLCDTRTKETLLTSTWYQLPCCVICLSKSSIAQPLRVTRASSLPCTHIRNLLGIAY